MSRTGKGITQGTAAAVRRPLRGRGALVTIGTVTALVAGMGLTVLGLGAADHAVAGYDASSWLWSSARSELARVNGLTGRVDTRVEVADSRSHQMQIVQTDQFLVLRDLATGQISSLNLATLQISATTRSTTGLGVSVALHDDAAFIVDAVQGVVRQIDPRSLQPVGEPVRYPPGITGGYFDGAGRLWIGVPSEGTVSAITAAPLPEAPAQGAPDTVFDSSLPVATPTTPDATAGLPGPTLVRTVAVAPPRNELALSALDDGVAVLNRTAGTVTVLRGDTTREIRLDLRGPGIMPTRSTGDQLVVTVPERRRVLMIDPAGAVSELTVPGEGTALRAAVAWAGRIYCADERAREVYAFDASGAAPTTIGIPEASGPLELEVRENHLFINAPDAATARVVTDQHEVHEVDKYVNDILGGDPPPAPPPPPPPPAPTVGPPGAPRNVTAAAGDTTARVTWRAAPDNGASILRYVITGAGTTVEVGANQRSFDVTGLTNGDTYRFSVHAVNAEGAGPRRESNPVVPTAAVPDAPTSVTAEARPDGSVLVSWPAADGQGNTVTGYVVTAGSAQSDAPAGDTDGTELVVAPGTLDYGTQYAFTVVAVSDQGAHSTASPLSNTVVPFTVPGEPGSVTASTVADQRGAIRVGWQPAAGNGRPVTGYVVVAGDRRTDVADGTGVTVTGLGDGADVPVSVHAVNEAGDGPAVTTTARTVAPPKVTVTGATADTNSVTLAFTVDAGGGQPSCSAGVDGGPTVTGGCDSIRVTGLWPGRSYTLTVRASNAAGTGTAGHTRATAALQGTATCVNGPDGEQRTYCDSDVPGRNGNEIFAVPEQDNDRQVGWVPNGTRLTALCRRSGEHVDAWIYNGNKASTWWIRVEYSGQNYIPWAWLNLAGGDNLNALPTC
ncbi:fibronectin type III domain-containing protein [Solwaraspora sp. WMMA2101]|uniref:fibronectin type III domain-containing protein n=1 Tax=Solwaraspora sp. WMMA2101 TaxID=3404124 RepID=UPI003B95C72A